MKTITITRPTRWPIAIGFAGGVVWAFWSAFDILRFNLHHSDIQIVLEVDND